MRTRAKRKHVAEIKLQEVDDMYQILMPGRTMVGENAISMAKEQISGLGSHALIREDRGKKRNCKEAD